jgi:endonuclease YncB( thermonuclease family)
MKKTLSLFLLVLIGGELDFPTLLGQTSSVKSEEVQVAEVLDGDSIEVFRSDGTREKIRYTAIGAPELNQPFGEEARRRHVELVAHKKVWLEWQEDKGKPARDRNGRLLAYIYLDKERTQPVALQLIQEGYGRVDIRGVRDSTPDDDFHLKWLKELVEAQIEAVKTRRGWWGKGDQYAASDLAIAFIKFWGPEEVVYIVNRGKESVDLADDFTLQDAAGKNKVSLRRLVGPGPCVLPSNGLLRVHSGRATVGKKDLFPKTGDQEMDCYWTGKSVWNNRGDEAILQSPDDKVISQYTYKGQAG